ncbi:two-component regulator propeller domain-containing protein [Tunturiibacter empetritectus]|uniref:Ligand-binding sensor domain-containing protein/signal transduction histidine kinase n=2 Tax=Tunturiibacter TaxID=3154218 RepID=A0A852VCH9_9BACT|nr:sensor histidine kinase [Edaphobacter lichenicola]NYF88991.1 ligand-binding sensor domain-containing protein/signal transduction histidine kinase [Edaphobacter lichenicola]
MKVYRLVGKLVAVLVAMCFARTVYAVDPNRAISQYMRENWGLERGFIGGAVSSIAQGPDGYLWVGTEKGLFRFDGMSFQEFQQQAPTALPIGPVQELITDSQSNLWILLTNTTILRYHAGMFDPGHSQAEVGITSIGRRRDGSALLSSLALGPLGYHAGKFDVLTAAQAPGRTDPAQAAVMNDELSSRLSWATGVATHRFAKPNTSVTAIAETSDGVVWLGTPDKGLFYLGGGQIHDIAPRVEGRINCLLPMQNGELWIGTDRGVLRWTGSKVTREGVPSELGKVSALSAIRDRDGNIWIGTSHGLLRFNARGVSSDEDDTVASNLAVNSLFEDREGDLWIGTPRGLERLRDSTFVSFAVDEDLRSTSGGPVYIDSGERTWFAPLDGGLRWLKDGVAEKVTAGGLDRDVVYSITGSQDELWVGRQRGGLTRLRVAKGGFETKTYTHADGLLQDSVYAVHQNRDGSVWAGTLSGGVSELRDGKFTSYTTANGMPSNTVTAMAEGADGSMWVATPVGLTQLLHGQLRTYTETEGLPSPDINCLLEDSNHVLWVGTTSGLAYFSGGAGHIPRNVPVALQEQIFGVAEDTNGWLWVATSNRVLRVRRDKLLNGSIAEGDEREYGTTDGLNGVEGVKRQRSVVEDSLGRIWFSMNHGLSVVDPIRAARGAALVLAKIDAVAVDGDLVDIKTAVRIPSARQRVTFGFSGVNLALPERVRYRYRLDGFDRGWSEPVEVRDAFYTNLGPGSYKFRVIAANSDGVWNLDGPSLDLTVVPAFYQTSWFLLLCAAAVAAVAWAVYQWHVGQVTSRMDLQFIERLSERTRIARELHDTLLQSFQGLILHFQTARDLIPRDPSEAEKNLDSALQSADQAMVEGRNAIYDIRSSTLVDHDLAHMITALGEELGGSLREGMRPGFSVVEEGTAKPLDSIFRDDIYHIVREALRNSFKHSEAQKIEAEITYGKRLLRVRIRDDGKGIDRKVLEQGERAGHWGLPGMRERAKRIGARLAVWSEAGAGTEVELNVSGSLVYESASPQLLSRLFRRSGARDKGL